MRIGFAGSGSIAAAMARGWAGADGFEGELAFTDTGSGRAAALAEEVGGAAADGNATLAAEADLVVLAMKPSRLGEVAAEIAPSGKPVISLLAGTSLATLGEALPGLPVIRVMPNIGIEVGRGVLCCAFSEGVNARLREQANGLLGLLGLVVDIDDGLIDPATAVMACSVAYVARFCEALADGAVREGIEEATANLMVVETLAGAAELLRKYEPAALSGAVAHPGSSTEAGLKALERGAFKEVLTSALDASLEKMRG
jgi:pyrroline-5-carboxylate reductase